MDVLFSSAFFSLCTEIRSLGAVGLVEFAVFLTSLAIQITSISRPQQAMPFLSLLPSIVAAD